MEGKLSPEKLAEFGRIYEEYSPDILNFISGITHYHHSAEDLASETFIRALRKFG